MNKLMPAVLMSFVFLSACGTTYAYEASPDMKAFYADKLKCETQFAGGFNIWGNKLYGNIYKEGPARDGMLSRGYRSL